MSIEFIYNIFERFIFSTMYYLDKLGPKIIAAIIVLTLGGVIAYATYKITMLIFKNFHIMDLIDRMWAGFEEQTTQIVDKNIDDNIEKLNKINQNKQKIRYDKITAKSFSYYIFLLFFRWAVVILGITEIEQFMQDLLAYLPSLFIGILIGFFGIRFANSVHDIIFQAMELTKQKTSSIIAMGAKIIIMFFTLMIMLNYIQIVDQFIINSLFLGFITTITIAFGLAFGIGGKEVAREILESFRK
ncbi:hypothetical protein GW846_05475 [Candidatus Gracilibacteria bacterium]|nr:hypothetical protein [Candidatus Gracilibacteria bacterium]